MRSVSIRRRTCWHIRGTAEPRARARAASNGSELVGRGTSYPAHAQKHLQALRALVLETAEELELELVETLKWGEPAFVMKAKSGSTIRLGWKAKEPDVCAMYFICTTTLVEGFRAQFGDVLRFEGNRALMLPLGEELPTSALKACIGDALTYHAKRTNT